MTIAPSHPAHPPPEVSHVQRVDPAAVSHDFLQRIPHDFAREHLILSQGEESIVVAETTSPFAIHNTGVRLGRRLTVELADSEAIARAIDEAYGNQRSETAPVAELHSSAASDEIDRLIQEADKDLLSTSGKGPIVRLVDAILFEALSRGASDVHVQPLPKTTLVRYRLDGVLHTVRELPPGATRSVISRIKVMGRMDLAERRVPQDGRAGVTIGDPTRNGDGERAGRAIDLRISTLPTSYGERAVVRLLDNTQQLCDLDSLGMPPDVQERYIERASRANGIILVTGPTGSGKTTTLYSTLRAIGSSRSNIMTIEDPIEYELSSLTTGSGDAIAISQSQVNARKGVTFATGLRHILRQDPDVVMVGEIRDQETARIAIQSSLTGHLVFSTLHTNDAASAITRLIDLGIEAYLVAASLSAVLAQRLVRTVHGECSGEGCDDCLGTGYRGRTGLFELMTIDEDLREQISHHASLRTLRELARRSGMRTLEDEGRRLIDAGVTTKLEVDRVVQGVM